jgi:hypothetical protein
VPLRTSIVVIWVIAALVAGAWVVSPCAQGVASDSSVVAAPDSSAVAAPDSIHSVTVQDSLGIPGTLKGQTDYDPAEVKKTLARMGSGEIEGKTTWERKKNPRTAMICSMVLPGLGQTYNGRKLKVGLMVGAMSYYAGNGVLNWRRYQSNSYQARTLPAGSDEQEKSAELADFYQEEARTFLWWSGAVWLLGLLDSWIDAHLYDVREYTPPPPPENNVPATGDEVSYLTLGFKLSFK